MLTVKGVFEIGYAVLIFRVKTLFNYAGTIMNFDITNTKEMTNRQVSAKKITTAIEVLRRRGGGAKGAMKIAIIPVMLDFYDTQCPDLRAGLDKFAKEFSGSLKVKDLDVIITPMVANDTQMRDACKKSMQQSVDLIVVAHMCYSPSGQLAPALLDCDVPVLLHPAQTLKELVAEEYNIEAIDMNHGVHGTMDLANILRRNGRPYGLLHGYWQDEAFRSKLHLFAQAARLIKEMKASNPIVLGGRFEKMLDLQLDNELFIKDFGVGPRNVSADEFTTFYEGLSVDSINRKAKDYRTKFDISDGVTDALLTKTARNELALRKMLAKFNSKAVGINFMNTASHPDIADALHVPANMLMAEGVGYAGEGDWENAMFMRGLQAACGIDQVSFTEIFSVGYRDNRFVLRHWGEGNISLARRKPLLSPSQFIGSDVKADFLINEFEFAAGPATLINLNATPDSKGQLISMPGAIDTEGLPESPGVRAIFRPDTEDTAQLLTDYSRLGGSHHMVMVRGDGQLLVDHLAQLTGWKQYRL